MRSKMLGLAVALSTFGVGVAAATLWLGRHVPQPLETVTRETRYVLVAEPPAAAAPAAPEAAPCDAARSNNAVFYGNTVSGGILNGKAVSQPLPAYPAAARAELVSGDVYVEIIVDVCGNVVMAKAVSGHPLLRQAAVDAAMRARFAPVRISGMPVAVRGTLAYKFSLQ